jgi:uncharacterized protein
MSIYLDPKHKALVEQIINRYHYQFYVFGSRATGQHRPFSDLDLCFKTTIPDTVLAQITMDFEESNLPFTVDVVDYNQCDAAFKKRMDATLISFNQ